jgi:(1->4)-alpha-D-glucan 1-alpha-D-glucosylmutase
VAERSSDVDPDLLGFLGDLLLLRLPAATPLEHDFALQFQQLSGPAMAKGVEDTAFYRYTRLLTLNEVGGDPGRFGVAVADFHEANRRVQERWPATMTTLSTHDTKRSADVRARLAVLSEVPDAWSAFAGDWLDRSSHLWSTSGGDPDRPTQWLLLQTLVGAWPLTPERAAAYLAKATKEAKLRTTWTEPDADFDTARDVYVAAVLGDPDLTAAVEAFVASIDAAGAVNGLAQQLLALTVPGVPDVYQGNELVDRSLVDPDNRRPVDFDRRRELLASLPGLSPEDLLARTDEGLPKLKVTREALHLRRRRPASFGAEGTYRPLRVTGAAADHVVAFSRGDDVAVVVPRLTLRLDGRWGDTAVALPPGRWSDVVTGATYDEPAPETRANPAPVSRAGSKGGGSGAGAIRVDGLLGRFPVALLERSD